MRFEILGPLRVHVGDVEVLVTAMRERSLLARLLLQVGQPVPTDSLVDAIWGEQRPAHAQNQLQICVSRLRRLLADAGHTREVIVTEPGGYRIPTTGVRVDLWEFRRQVAEARAAADCDPHKARDRYRSAIALWRGAALAGVNSDSVRRFAAPLEEERLRATEECIDIELAIGGAGELVAELTDLVGQHRYREGLHRALMLAMYRAGRRADALAAYRYLHNLLAAELGLEPGTALRDLHQRILADDTTLSWAGPGQTSGQVPRGPVR